MGHVQPIERAELSDYERMFSRFERSMGYVPNSLFVMGHRPELLEAFCRLVGVIAGPGQVDQGLKQLVAHVASAVSGCRYCQAHTATLAHNYGVDADRIEAVWQFEQDERFSDAERAALRLARDAAQQPSAASAAHFAELAAHFDDGQIVEIVSVIALFGFLNRWNDTLATDLEDEPFDFARTHLADAGWQPGRHRSAEESTRS
jgi:uncharacterized peroxidase-related enzyme